MDAFNYREGVLFGEDLPVSTIAEAAGTPCYVYSKRTLLDHYDRLVAAFAPLRPLICFSIKSCPNLSILRVLAERGAGMDLVSGGELHRAMQAGAAPQHCVYAGVGKTDREIIEALDAGIGWFNVESEQEFENLARLARQRNVTCRAALRVNPDVDPKTHRYTTTGKKETKFGVDLDRARRFFADYGRDEHCLLRGLHLHLGSPIYTVDPYVSALERTLPLIDELADEGITIEMLDLGGGFGADYTTEQTPLATKYAEAIIPLLKDRVDNGLQLVLEPGRTIAANAGIMLTRVLYTKSSGEKTFVICDAGMNVLLRPSHYDAFHFMWPAEVEAQFVPPRRAAEPELDLPGAGLMKVDVVGPICETGDFLALERLLPPMQRGDLLAVFTAGAYGMAMSSRYNAMPLPAEVLVDGGIAQLVRRRETYDDLTEHERDPAPLKIETTTAGARVGQTAAFAGA